MVIIGHIIGLDEIHKKQLAKRLPSGVAVIDLDQIQQSVYNHKDIIKQKLVWEQLGRDIIIHRRHRKIIGSKRTKVPRIEHQIKKLLSKRNQVRQYIHQLWKTKMNNEIQKELSLKKKYRIIFVGFNIFPKDYRIKINLHLPKYSNRMIFNTNPKKYAANQIKFYLNTYSNKIMHGTFPLNLLKVDYLANKYDKFTTYYHKQGYLLSSMDQMVRITNAHVYVATLYKADVIPVNSRTPIEGYYRKADALAAIKSKMRQNRPVYVYQIMADQFHLIDGKLIATQELHPLDEESILLT